MGAFKNIFTWWDGATFGTALGTMLRGVRVGQDAQGNVYYRARNARNGMTRRWVMYAGANDASRVPPEWHGWLHHQVDELPDKSLPPPRRWEKEPKANLTGTDLAYRPPGALEVGGKRAPATGDYEAWSPDAA